MYFIQDYLRLTKPDPYNIQPFKNQSYSNLMRTSLGVPYLGLSYVNQTEFL